MLKKHLFKVVVVLMIMLIPISIVFYDFGNDSGDKFETITIVRKNKIVFGNTRLYKFYIAKTDSGNDKKFMIKRSKIKLLFGLKSGDKYEVKYFTTKSGKNIIKSYKALN